MRICGLYLSAEISALIFSSRLYPRPLPALHRIITRNAGYPDAVVENRHSLIFVIKRSLCSHSAYSDLY
jgi:hypothetical protein